MLPTDDNTSGRRQPRCRLGDNGAAELERCLQGLERSEHRYPVVVPVVATLSVHVNPNSVDYVVSGSLVRQQVRWGPRVVLRWRGGQRAAAELQRVEQRLELTAVRCEVLSVLPGERPGLAVERCWNTTWGAIIEPKAQHWRAQC